MYLLEKFLQVRTALVPYPCFRKQPAAISSLEDTDTEVDVLAETHPGKSAQCLIHIGPDSHVETAGVELVHFLLSSPDSSRGEKRSHGIIDGFLYVSKRIVRPVGTTERICRFPLQFRFHRSQVSSRQNTIGIQNQQILSPAPFGRIVPRLPRTGIRFLKIMDIQFSFIFFHNLLARNGRTVFHYHHLEVLIGLSGQALQQFVHLIRAVIHRYDH